MSRWRGTGLGTGMAMGTVAVVRLRNGFPLVPPIPPRIVEMLSNPRLAETPDIVLVAEEYQNALQIASSLRWGRVVGIAAATSSPDAPAAEFPAVVDIPGLMERVDDDMLMVVDAIRGVVAADADGFAALQYQAEHQFDNASKRRLYLDNSHQPAITLDGHTIQVIAQVSTVEEIEAAQEEGADALCVPFNCPLLPDEAEEKAMRQALRVLTDLAAGKPLIFLDDQYALAPRMVLEAANRADMTVAVPPMEPMDGLGLDELRGELNSALAECLEADIACDLPRLAAYLPDLRHLPTEPEPLLSYIDRLSAVGATRLIVGSEANGETNELLLPELDRLVATAANDVLPVWMTVDPYIFFGLHALGDSTAFDATVPLLLGTGVGGLVVIPTGVRQIKTAIQNLNHYECRNLLTQRLQEPRPGT